MSSDFQRMRNAVRRDMQAITNATAQPRHAIVQAVDPTTHTVRLMLQPEGVLTGWVQDASAFATGGGFGVVAPLSPGDQAVVLHAHGDADEPIIVGRLFSTVDMPPVSPATGKPVQPGEFGVFTDDAWLHITSGAICARARSIQIQADADVSLTTPSVTSSGNLSVGTGATGSFSTGTGTTVTVQGGIIVNIM